MIASVYCRAQLWLGISGALLLSASLARAELPGLPALPALTSLPALPSLPSLAETAQRVVNPLAARWQAHFAAASQATGVDAQLLEALAGVESNFNAQAVSRFGATGLLQIMPRTAASVGLRGNHQAMRRQLLDPQTNVLTGARLMRQLIDMFEGKLDVALAAYNAGVGNVLKAGGRVPPNRETPDFVRKVLDRYNLLRGPVNSPLSVTGPVSGASSTVSTVSTVSATNVTSSEAAGEPSLATGAPTDLKTATHSPVELTNEHATQSPSVGSADAVPR